MHDQTSRTSVALAEEFDAGWLDDVACLLRHLQEISLEKVQAEHVLTGDAW